jgi:hypothetical protein
MSTMMSVMSMMSTMRVRMMMSWTIYMNIFYNCCMNIKWSLMMTPKTKPWWAEVRGTYHYRWDKQRGATNVNWVWLRYLLDIHSLRLRLLLDNLYRSCCWGSGLLLGLSILLLGRSLVTLIIWLTVRCLNWISRRRCIVLLRSIICRGSIVRRYRLLLLVYRWRSLIRLRLCVVLRGLLLLTLSIQLWIIVGVWLRWLTIHVRCLRLAVRIIGLWSSLIDGRGLLLRILRRLLIGHI